MSNPELIAERRAILMSAKFETLKEGFVKYGMDAFFGKEKKLGGSSERSQAILFFIVLGILAYVGEAVTAAIFRTNFGTKGLSRLKIVTAVFLFVCLVCFFGFEYLAYGTNVDHTLFGSKGSYLLGVVLYSVLIIQVIYKAFVAPRTDRQIGKYYRGTSSILSWLVDFDRNGDGGWKQSSVQNWAEPLLLLVFGGLLSSFNPIVGLPLMMCAISSWLHFIVELVLGIIDARNNMSDVGGHVEAGEYVIVQ